MAPKKAKAKATTAATKAGVRKKTNDKAGAKAKKNPTKTKKTDQPEELGAEANPSGIVIEACKQCNAFKTRALKLEELLKSGKEGLEVTINPVKPRRGYFEVRNGDTGEQYISLPKMQRPFPPLKALEIDQVAEDILGKLKDE